MQGPQGPGNGILDANYHVLPPTHEWVTRQHIVVHLKIGLALPSACTCSDTTRLHVICKQATNSKPAMQSFITKASDRPTTLPACRGPTVSHIPASLHVAPHLQDVVDLRKFHETAPPSVAASQADAKPWKTPLGPLPASMAQFSPMITSFFSSAMSTMSAMAEMGAKDQRLENQTLF